MQLQDRHSTKAGGTSATTDPVMERATDQQAFALMPNCVNAPTSMASCTLLSQPYNGSSQNKPGRPNPSFELQPPKLPVATGGKAASRASPFTTSQDRSPRSLSPEALSSAPTLLPTFNDHAQHPSLRQHHKFRAQATRGTVARNRQRVTNARQDPSGRGMKNNSAKPACPQVEILHPKQPRIKGRTTRQSQFSLSVHVSHIPLHASWGDLAECFQKLGPTARIYQKPETTWAHIHFYDPQHVEDAMKASIAGTLRVCGQRVKVSRRKKGRHSAAAALKAQENSNEKNTLASLPLCETPPKKGRTGATVPGINTPFALNDSSSYSTYGDSETSPKHLHFSEKKWRSINRHHRRSRRNSVDSHTSSGSSSANTSSDHEDSDSSNPIGYHKEKDHGRSLRVREDEDLWARSTQNSTSRSIFSNSSHSVLSASRPNGSALTKSYQKNDPWNTTAEAVTNVSSIFNTSHSCLFARPSIST